MSGRLKMAKAIQIDKRDNVATVTSDVGAGEVVEVLSPEGEVLMSPPMKGEVSFGHKIALKGLEKGDKVVKYGEVIGVASSSIGVGVWVHTHNVESAAVPTSAYLEGDA
jgi:altronate dehydratase small subunit